jgi:hypothetical protein
MGLDELNQLGQEDQPLLQTMSDCLVGDVIMGWTDPPSCDHMGELLGEEGHFFSDDIHLIWNDGYFADIHPQCVELLSNVMRIGICHLPFSDFIPDDDDASSALGRH